MSLGRPLTALVTMMLAAFASVAYPAWINVGNNQLGQGELYLLIETTTGGALTITFNVTDPTPGVATVGTPNLQIQMGVRRPGGGGGDITATLSATYPGNLSGGPTPINVQDITWTSVALTGTPGGYAQLNIAGGQMGVTNPIDSLTTAGGATFWKGAEFHFTFTPSQLYSQGNYSGIVYFTASRT